MKGLQPPAGPPGGRAAGVTGLLTCSRAAGLGLRCPSPHLVTWKASMMDFTPVVVTVKMPGVRRAPHSSLCPFPPVTESLALRGMPLAFPNVRGHVSPCQDVMLPGPVGPHKLGPGVFSGCHGQKHLRAALEQNSDFSRQLTGGKLRPRPTEGDR